MKRDYYSLDEIEKEIFKGVKDEQEGKVIPIEEACKEIEEMLNE